MIKLRSKIRRVLGPLFTAGLVFSVGAQQSAADSSAFQKMLDSLGISKETLEGKVRSTILFGGSAPVSFSGEARLKLQLHRFPDSFPKWMGPDKSWLQANWEGNESFIRIGMIAHAGRNAILWSKIGFQNTMPGGQVDNSLSQNPIWERVTGPHDKSREFLNVHEDMNAGMYVRTVPASFFFRLGAIHWIEASPLTIWKSQPRTFAWEYLPFEVEQPISRYFEYNLAKGEKSGRAAWNKKPFQGINLESVNLPGNLYFNFLYGTAQKFDPLEREAIDFSNDLALAGEGQVLKARGLNNTYQHVIHSRLAANELIGRLTPALNFVRVTVDEDVVFNSLFNRTFKIGEFKTANVTDSFARDGSGNLIVKKVPTTITNDAGFFKEPTVFSADIRGPLSDNFSIHADLGLTNVDTTFAMYKGKYDSVFTDASGSNYKKWFIADTSLKIDSLHHSQSGPKFGAYVSLENKKVLPIKADLSFVQKGFYSPFSFVNTANMFFPIGSNLVGPGSFAGSEASPVIQNLTGLRLTVSPKLKGYGHLRFIYGNHLQIEAGPDVLFFPYRLNGQDMFTFFHTSYNRWGNDLLDASMIATKPYRKRLGDESFVRPTSDIGALGPDAGGLRSAYLSMTESFVPYLDTAQAAANLRDKDVSISKMSKYVPVTRKYSTNAEFDASYDFGPIIGYKREVFMGLYGAINGVSNAFKALSFSDKSDGMQLWGSYLRFEPAIAVSSKFYILGMAGVERWKSQMAYMAMSSNSTDDKEWVKENVSDTLTWTGTKVFNVPMDYTDYAFGVGFDWDMLARVGLHGRVKWLGHNDATYKYNNLKPTPVISTEIKMWF